MGRDNTNGIDSMRIVKTVLNLTMLHLAATHSERLENSIELGRFMGHQDIRKASVLSPKASKLVRILDGSF